LSNRPTKFYVYSFNNGVKGELLKVIYLNSKEIQRFTIPTNNIYIEWDSTKNTGFITDEVITLRKDNAYQVGDWAYNCDKQFYYVSRQEWVNCMNSESEKNLTEVGNNYIALKGMNVNTAYNLDFSNFFNNNGKLDYAWSGTVFQVTPTKTITQKQITIASTIKGRILLQVQQHGEAWYVRPSSGLRYYMKDGHVAYDMMRNFGLGITDKDLAIIPSAESIEELKSSTSVCSTNSLANRVKGNILLQTEQHGEAWYVDVVKCRRIYMKDGAAAYSLMRFLGLGITDLDLAKLPIGH
jgi:hypothetical protein